MKKKKKRGFIRGGWEGPAAGRLADPRRQPGGEKKEKKRKKDANAGKKKERMVLARIFILDSNLRKKKKRGGKENGLFPARLPFFRLALADEAHKGKKE